MEPGKIKRAFSTLHIGFHDQQFQSILYRGSQNFSFLETLEWRLVYEMCEKMVVTQCETGTTYNGQEISRMQTAMCGQALP